MEPDKPLVFKSEEGKKTSLSNRITQSPVTTVSGIGLAVGSALLALVGADGRITTGTAVIALGTLILGLFAKD